MKNYLSNVQQDINAEVDFYVFYSIARENVSKNDSTTKYKHDLQKL